MTKEYRKQVAEKILAAMKLHESSWVTNKNAEDPRDRFDGEYSRTLQSCFDEQFGDDPMKQLYYVAVSADHEAAWNSIQSWCADVINEEEARL